MLSRLTDHDTTSGWAEAIDALPAGLTLVRGTEISCEIDGVSMHLLAYLFDPSHEGLAEEMGMAFDDRTAACQGDRRKARGSRVIPLAGRTCVDRLEPGATVGRPHIADVLVAKGVVPDRNTAFTSCCTTTGRSSSITTTSTRSRQSSSCAPPAASRSSPTRPRRTAAGPSTTVSITKLADAGLAGIEVDHRDNPPEARVRLRAAGRRARPARHRCE